MTHSYVREKNLLKNLKTEAPYITTADRLATFKRFAYDKRFDATCTSEKLAHAGFNSSANPDLPFSAKCPFCMVELDFDQFDDAWEKHKSAKPDCDFVKFGAFNENQLTIRQIAILAMRCATVKMFEEMLEIITKLKNCDNIPDNKMIRYEISKKIAVFRNASKMLTNEHRLATFSNWIYDKKKGAACTSRKVAKSGFVSTASKRLGRSAECPFCLKNFVFGEADDPWTEHQKYSPDCDFVKLGKLDEKQWTEEEALMLCARIVVLKKYKKGNWLIDELERENKTKELLDIKKMMVKPKIAMGRRRII